MKKLVSSVLSLATVAVLSFGAMSIAHSAEEEGATPHYPIHKPKEMDWSFGGPFGTFDKGQLQRGLKVYKEVCSACHSMELVAFRTLSDLGYSEGQIKTLAGEYEVQDGPNADGEMYTRKAVASDYFPSPFPNPIAAAASNNGAAPPDFSLIAKARGVERGFPKFIFDMIPIVGGYQEGGPDYIHALLTGYQEPPAGVEVAEGTHYNPYFIAGSALAMAPPLSADQITYDDGSPQTVEQYSTDVSAFLMWAAEPHLEQRKRTGFMVIIFLMIFATLVYLTKKSVYANKPE
jgi:ubiquinol-cytochrome c reductase cytochrome c1 subunit